MTTTDLRQHEHGDRARIITEVNRLTSDYAGRIDNITNNLGNAGGVPQAHIDELHDIANRLRAIAAEPSLKLEERPRTGNDGLAPPFQRNTQPPLVPERTVVQEDHGVRHDHQNGITTYDDGTKATDAAIGNGKAGARDAG